MPGLSPGLSPQEFARAITQLQPDWQNQTVLTTAQTGVSSGYVSLPAIAGSQAYNLATLTGSAR
jgi:hypothetical protein